MKTSAVPGLELFEDALVMAVGINGLQSSRLSFGGGGDFLGGGDVVDDGLSLEDPSWVLLPVLWRCGETEKEGDAVEEDGRES